MTSTISIDAPYPLTDQQIEKFRTDGYIKLKDVLSPAIIERYRHEITSKVKEMSADKEDLKDRDTYGKAFLQVPNLWVYSELVKEFVLGKRMGRIAAQLMGTTGVRLYHDQALYKEPGGGFTPWHVDQVYWPLSNNNTVTAWIPLLALPVEMGALEFSVGSQKITFGREMEISDESEKLIDEHLKLRDFPIDSGAFDLGEVSFHYGYTFHRAGPNNTTTPREVMTIIYMDEHMRVTEPKSQAQRNDLEGWMPGVEVGEVAASPLNPVVYSENS